MDDMRKKMCGAERFAVWFKKFLKLCIVVLLLSAALFEIWRIWGAQHKPIDTADNGQMTAPLFPLQNPTLISGEHGYRSNKEEISEPFAVTSKSKETEERWDEEIPWFIKGCKGLETESKRFRASGLRTAQDAQIARYFSLACFCRNRPSGSTRSWAGPRGPRAYRPAAGGQSPCPTTKHDPVAGRHPARGAGP